MILHSILRYTDPDDAVIFKALLLKMSKEYCKKSNSKYFDTNAIMEVYPNQESQQYKDFLKAYSTYVLKRSRAFTSQFEEMDLITKGMRTEDVCAQVR
jgi:hypothetical protein